MSDPDSPHDITIKQRKAIVALLEAPTIREAARLAGLPESSLYRWTAHNEAFQREWRAQVRLASHAARSRLRVLTAQAVDTLREVMTDTAAPHAARVAAARSILELAFKAEDTDDIIARLRALEEHHDAIPQS